MKAKTTLVRIFLLLAVMILPTGSAHAQGPGGDVVLFGQNYTLEKGEELAGSLAVFGGNIKVEEGASVHGDIALIGGNFAMDGDVSGDVAVIGGNLTISGKVDGDIVIIGGQVDLKATAVVDGDIATIGGQVERDPEAQVSGDIVNNAPPIHIPDVPNVPNLPEVPDVPNVPNVPNLPSVPEPVYSYNPWWDGMSVLLRALAVAAIGMLLTLFFQTQFDRVGSAIVRQPVLAGSFGLLMVVVAPLAILIMIVTILLIPVALIVAMLIPLAWLFGVIALGQEVGDRFTKAINQTWAPVLSTGFGTFLLMLLGGYIGMVPCVGWLVPLVVALIGMGGVMMTWFGTRSAPGAMPLPMQVPSAESSD